jgi:hypothetical protein
MRPTHPAPPSEPPHTTSPLTHSYVRRAENLRTQRTNMQQEFKAKTHPAAVKVWLSTQLVRKELVNTGTKTPEWVKENLPSVECPKS